MSLNNILLPPLEYRKGPKGNLDDGIYIHKAKVLVNSIVALLNASFDAPELAPDILSKSKILDIGCGPLRLITGLQASGTDYASYTGVDVDHDIIDWATGNFADNTHEFHCIDMENSRYNPQGTQLSTLALPVDDDSFDIVILRSVFTHMTMGDIGLYLPEISQKLKAGGKLYLSIYVDEDLVLKERNLNEYNATPAQGPLHKQIVSRQWFERKLNENGLDVVCFCPNILNQPTYLIVRKC
jgi:SAM-dependent methyltransferase